MSDTKVILTNVRFSFPYVFAPHAFKAGDDEKYRLVILIDKDDDANLDKIEDAIDAAAKASKEPLGKKWDSPLHDGDEDKPEDEVFADTFYLNSNSNTKPAVVDENLDPILDKEDFYAGCVGNVSVTFKAYNTKGGKGVGCYLNNVQKTDDGERIGARKATAEEDFGAISGKKKRSSKKDDERPARRSSRRDEEEEEERPSRRSRRDEEEEERPRSRRR